MLHSCMCTVLHMANGDGVFDVLFLGEFYYFENKIYCDVSTPAELKRTFIDHY